MSVEITYRCNGCFAEETVSGVQAERVVLTPNVFVRNGVEWDKTRVERPSIESVAPDGWIVWDPYTQMTYCAECWASIEGKEEALEYWEQTSATERIRDEP